MMIVHLLLFKLLLWLAAPVGTPPPAVEAERDEIAALHAELCLEDVLEADVFATAYRRMRTADPAMRHVAIADMTRPSTEARLHLIDLAERTVVLSTWVAHGQHTGELMAEHFSNRNGSHQTSLGLYRVGAAIESPKHGPALLLHGLDKGVNCQALPREIIVHGADYVSAAFIAEHGRLGRSWGCPAVERAVMPLLIGHLAEGGLLYVYGR